MLCCSRQWARLPTAVILRRCRGLSVDVESLYKVALFLVTILGFSGWILMFFRGSDAATAYRERRAAFYVLLRMYIHGWQNASLLAVSVRPLRWHCNPICDVLPGRLHVAQELVHEDAGFVVGWL